MVYVKKRGVGEAIKTKGVKGMDIATVKARMTEFFGKDDMYRMPLGVVMEDWLVAEHDRLTSDLTSAKEEIGRHNEARVLLQTKLSLPKDAGLGWAGTVAAQIGSLQYDLASERKETERLQYELNQIFGIACDAPELNMSNYDVDQVAALNTAMIEIWQTAKAALQSRQGEE